MEAEPRAIEQGTPSQESEPDHDEDAASPTLRSRIVVPLDRTSMLHASLLLTHLGLTATALSTPFFERSLSGSVISLAAEFGIQLDDTFSLLQIATLLHLSLPNLVNAFSYFLFVLITPLLTPLTSLAVLCGSWTGWLSVHRLRQLHSLSRQFSFFAGLEVRHQPPHTRD